MPRLRPRASRSLDAIMVARLAILDRRGGWRWRPPRCAPCAPATSDDARGRRSRKSCMPSSIDAGEQAAIWQRGAYARHVLDSGRRRQLADRARRRAAVASRARAGASACSHMRLQDGAELPALRRAAIPFLIGNEAAERCYARAGFAFAEEKRDAGIRSAHRASPWLSPVLSGRF